MMMLMMIKTVMMGSIWSFCFSTNHLSVDSADIKGIVLINSFKKRLVSLYKLYVKKNTPNSKINIIPLISDSLFFIYRSNDIVAFTRNSLYLLSVWLIKKDYWSLGTDLNFFLLSKQESRWEAGNFKWLIHDQVIKLWIIFEKKKISKGTKIENPWHVVSACV